MQHVNENLFSVNDLKIELDCHMLLSVKMHFYHGLKKENSPRPSGVATNFIKVNRDKAE